MNILVINAGSSSLKYQLIRMEDESILCKGVCERIGIDGKYSYKAMNGYKVEKEADLFTHKDAFDVILHEMVQGEGHVIDSVNEIAAIGHRVTHGGDKFSHSVLVDEATIDAIANMRDISPLHNPPQAATIRACRTVFGEALPMAAVFDTAFHATMPPKAYTFAIPYKYYEEHGVRRYGFHGTSHRYVSGRMAELLGEMPHRLITCHLGNGSSLAAIKDGKVVDTSMGFTPLDGIIMGTRCGSIDPSIVSYIANLENLHERGMNRLLNNESGLLGVSGVSSDFRDVLEEAENGNERAQLAADMLEYQLVKLIGSYAAGAGRGGCHSVYRRHRRKCHGPAGAGDARSGLPGRDRRPGGQQQPRRGGSHLRGGQQGGGMGSAHQRGDHDRAGYCGADKISAGRWPVKATPPSGRTAAPAKAPQSRMALGDGGVGRAGASKGAVTAPAGASRPLWRTAMGGRRPPRRRCRRPCGRGPVPAVVQWPRSGAGSSSRKRREMHQMPASATRV